MSTVTIKPEPFCENHLSLLIHGAKFKPTDPWKILTVVAQCALVQVASASKITHAKLGNDFSRINELGCLACWSPKAFSEIVKLAKGKKDVSEFAPIIKKYGESFIFKDEGKA